MIAQAAMNSRVVGTHLRAVVGHGDQHRYPVGVGAVQVGSGGGAGAQRGKQPAVDTFGQLLLVEGGQERGLDLAGRLLGRDQSGGDLSFSNGLVRCHLRQCDHLAPRA